MKIVENLLFTVGALLMVLATDPWSSLSNGLTEQEKSKEEQDRQRKEQINNIIFSNVLLFKRLTLYYYLTNKQ